MREAVFIPMPAPNPSFVEVNSKELGVVALNEVENCTPIDVHLIPKSERKKKITSNPDGTSGAEGKQEDSQEVDLIDNPVSSALSPQKNTGAGILGLDLLNETGATQDDLLGGKEDLLGEDLLGGPTFKGTAHSIPTNLLGGDLLGGPDLISTTHTKQIPESKGPSILDATDLLGISPAPAPVVSSLLQGDLMGGDLLGLETKPATQAKPEVDLFGGLDLLGGGS